MYCLIFKRNKALEDNVLIIVSVYLKSHSTTITVSPLYACINCNHCHTSFYKLKPTRLSVSKHAHTRTHTHTHTTRRQTVSWTCDGTKYKILWQYTFMCECCVSWLSGHCCIHHIKLQPHKHKHLLFSPGRKHETYLQISVLILHYSVTKNNKHISYQ